MLKKLVTVAILSASGFTLGCGGGSSGPVPLDNVCEEMKSALCDYLDKCDLEWYMQFATHTTCDDLLDCQHDMDLDEIARAVDAGRIAYDADLAGSCLHAIRAADCADISAVFENMPDDCQSVFGGLVAEDGNCYINGECADGMYCDRSVSDCPGVCTPYKSIDDSCSGGDCDPDEAGCDYQQGVCVALAGSGESCDNIDCRDGLVCNSDNNPSVCIVPASAGQSCSSTRGCEAGLQCVGGKCVGPAGAGKSCNIGLDYSNIMFACGPGYYCDADFVQGESNGICRSKKGSGAECVMFYECKANLLCIGTQINQQTKEVTPGSCGKPLGQGAACNPGLQVPECNWDLYCDGDTSVCKAYPGAGDECTPNQSPDCLGNDLYCDATSGKCEQKKADGEDCTDYEECQSDNCDIYDTGKCLPSNSCEEP